MAIRLQQLLLLLDTDELEFPRDLGNGTVVGTFQIPRTYGIDMAVDF